MPKVWDATRGLRAMGALKVRGKAFSSISHRFICYTHSSDLENGFNKSAKIRKQKLQIQK